MKAISITFLLLLTALTSSEAVMSTQKKEKILERVRYVEYTGNEQDWPTNNAPMIDIEHSKYGMTIYHNLPQKHYEVLGTIRASGDSLMKHVAEAAQAVGADAVLVTPDKAFTDAGINIVPDVSSRGSGQGKTKLLEGIFIRWTLQHNEAATKPQERTHQVVTRTQWKAVRDE